MAQIKPIQTEYKGYLFRSRLEARWAVFFDACGVKWEYEPEGFDLGNGLYYLPDFLLHDVYTHASGGLSYLGDLWVEVKGQMTEEDRHKLYVFSEQFPVYIVTNIPEGESFFDLIFNMCTKDDILISPFNFNGIDADNYDAFPYVDKQGRFVIAGADGDYLDNRDEQTTVEAYRLARQARFEHGENPASVNPIKPQTTVFKPQPAISKELYTFIKKLYPKLIPNGICNGTLVKLSALEKECGTINVVDAIRKEEVHCYGGLKDFFANNPDDCTFNWIASFAHYPVLPPVAKFFNCVTIQPFDRQIIVYHFDGELGVLYDQFLSTYEVAVNCNKTRQVYNSVFRRVPAFSCLIDIYDADYSQFLRLKDLPTALNYFAKLEPDGFHAINAAEFKKCLDSFKN